MRKRISGIAFLLILFAVPVLLLYTIGTKPLYRAATARSNPLNQLEETLTEQFPGADILRALQVSLSYAGGSKEQNGVFISEGKLMLDLQPKNLTLSNSNMLAMIDFAGISGRPSYVMLVPTACAIMQSSVPYAEVAPLYNQKQFIEDVYRRVSGHVTAINVYPTLFNHQDEYLYYNTANTLTGMGGYYVYAAAAPKLGISKVRGIEEFEVEHLDYQYYGDLYRRSPYRAVKPDRVSAYSFSRSWRSYEVTHYDADGARRYYTLYPRFKQKLGDTMDVLLGGMSPVVDIRIGDPLNNRRQLLIFGDRSVQSYLPFLMINYERVTVVNTATVTPALLKKINVDSYNQVLFSYGVDSFMTADQLSVLNTLEPEEES